MMKIILFGCGSIARNRWVPALKSLPSVEVVAVVDVQREGAQALAREFQADIPAYTDSLKAMKEVKADVAACCLPIALHGELIQEALNHGLHVFTEKPLVDSLESARNVTTLAKQKGKRIFVCQNRRWFKRARQIENMLRDGTIGKLVRLDVRYHNRIQPHPVMHTSPSAFVMDMGVHHFDLVRFFSDTGAKTVSARALIPENGPWADKVAGIDASLEMENGAYVRYTGAWWRSGPATSGNGTWFMEGEKGCIYWDGEGIPEVYIENNEAGTMPIRTRLIPAPDDQADGHQLCLNKMVEALESGQPFPTEAHAYWNTQALAAMTMLSTENHGEVVSVPPLNR